MKLNVVCVYKTGRVYTEEYVRKLYEGVSANLSLDHEFICLTDSPSSVGFCETIPLKHKWPGWWSKIELFRPDLPFQACLYFDLDTIILGNIDELVRLAFEFPFITLRGFNQHYAFKHRRELNLATGVMAGNFPSCAKIYHTFCQKPDEHMKAKRERWRHGDQGFVASIVGLDGPRLQDYLPDDYIVGKKRTGKGTRIPKKARVLAWSGNPRLHTITEGPVAELWRKA